MLTLPATRPFEVDLNEFWSKTWGTHWHVWSIDGATLAQLRRKEMACHGGGCSGLSGPLYAWDGAAWVRAYTGSAVLAGVREFCVVDGECDLKEKAA